MAESDANIYAHKMTHHDHDEKARAAREELKKLQAPNNLLSGLLGDNLRRATEHLSGKDGGNDPVEVWGRRIGRILSVGAFILLAIYVAKMLWH